MSQEEKKTHDRRTPFIVRRYDVSSCAIHPGEMLQEEFLSPLGISHQDLAEKIETSEKEIRELVNGSKMTTEIAEKLAKYFGTSVQFWTNLQTNFDSHRE